ncbi:MULTISPECIES: hypothetical protein [Streptomyces]|nr:MULTISPECIES: hypothetical protein [Streptomyces]
MDKIAESLHNPELGEVTRDDWTMVDLIESTEEKAQALGLESLDQ